MFCLYKNILTRGERMDKPRLTETDFERLSALAGALRRSRQPGRASVLGERLQNALVFQTDGVVWNHVTMNSLVTIRDQKSGEAFTYKLVFPADADIADGRISVLTPLGAELLGRCEGESFSYESPGGRMGVSVERVVHEA
jgi:regulator of nucleoside diphosphate kinase